MEFEFFISGVGGQGVQLVCKVMALAATAEGRYAMLSSEYGGQMRGGSSMGTVVIGTERLRALPVVAEARSALALHHLYFEETAARLRPGSLIVAESGIANQLPDIDRHRVIAIPAAKIAADIGNPQSGGFVMLGAYNAITGLVELDSLVAAMKELIPAYRRQHIEVNERALRAGAAAAPALAAPVRLGASQAMEAAR